MVGSCVAGDVLPIGLHRAAVPPLMGLALGSARQALVCANPGPGAGARGATMRAALARTAMPTFGNPAAWIETVLIVGAAASSQGDAAPRWAFALGACVASAVRFSALGCGARVFAAWLHREAVLRSPSAFSAVRLVAAAWQVAPLDGL